MQTYPPSGSSISRSPCSPTFVQTEALSSITARATDPADGSLPHSLNPPSIRWSPDGWSRSSRCNGHSKARTASCKFALPSSTATWATAWLGSLQSRRTDVAWRGCSSRPHHCSRPHEAQLIYRSRRCGRFRRGSQPMEARLTDRRINLKQLVERLKFLGR
jgi:hypothetical protein